MSQTPPVSGAGKVALCAAIGTIAVIASCHARAGAEPRQPKSDFRHQYGWWLAQSARITCLRDAKPGGAPGSRRATF